MFTKSKNCNINYLAQVIKIGVAIRKDVLNIESYKFKSFSFLQKETKDLDAGLENIEG